MRISRCLSFTLLVLGSASGCVAKGGGNDFASEGVQGTAGAAGAAGASNGAAGSSTGLAGTLPFLTINPEASFEDPDATHGTGVYMLPAGFTAGKKGGYKLGDPLGAMLPPRRRTRAAWEDAAERSAESPATSNAATSGGHPTSRSSWAGEKRASSSAARHRSQAGLCRRHAQVHDHQGQFRSVVSQRGRREQTVPGFLVVEPNGIVFTFESQEFFPLDGQGWGNEGFNPDHNFAFTTEVHTTFQYNGGETFSFSGDDDVWVFINGKLAIDLGGLHPVQMDQVSLDAAADMLGITKGKVYSLDLFHAERHSTASNFRIDTNLQFVDCGIIVDIAR